MPRRVLVTPPRPAHRTWRFTVDDHTVAHDVRPHDDRERPARPPRTAACAGCGSRHPRRELVELHEDNHDDLTYFHGDRLCASCADGAGVMR